MNPRAVRLDFVPRPRRPGAVGAALAVAGLIAAGLMADDLLRLQALRTDLAEEIEARERASQPARPSAADSRAGEEEAAVRRELGLPWSRLLKELEQAGHDTGGTAALLAVEPDPDKRQLRITAETRTLGPALAYVERLQASPVLRYPTLESHEVRSDDPEHPVRVTIVAGWRL